MKYRIVWLDPVRDAFLELPEKDREEIIQKLDALASFPRMYAVRFLGRFRRHRCFVSGDWAVFYRVSGQTVYVRGIWPARIP